jgi:undecaprenyl-diphosphatase
VAKLGSLPALIAGATLAALLVVRRDRWRAAAFLCAPVVAGLAVEWLLKPVVGRRYEGVLCYPSGTVTIIAAVSTALVLAVPTRLRWIATPMAGATVAVMAVAVVGLRWHYPSDAVAGAMFGAGTVLMVDGVVALLRQPAAEADSPLGPD